MQVDSRTCASQPQLALTPQVRQHCCAHTTAICRIEVDSPKILARCSPESPVRTSDFVPACNSPTTAMDGSEYPHRS